METKSPEVSKADSSLTAQQLLSKGLRSAQVEGEYCDLLLSCQGYQWKAHRVVLCSWSSFFKNACKDGFKEGTSGVIDLKEDDPDTVARMLQFCYTYDYQIIVDDKALASDVVVDPMLVNARIYFVADKYDIGPLKDLAKKKFEEVVKEQWRLESFPTVIKAIYENTLPSDSLRVCLVSVVKRHKKELRESIAFMEVVRSGGDFAADVFDAWTNDKAPAVSASGYERMIPKTDNEEYWCHASASYWVYTLSEAKNGHCRHCLRGLFLDHKGKMCEHTLL